MSTEQTQMKDGLAASLDRLVLLLGWERNIAATLTAAIRARVPSCGNPPIERKTLG